jgi:hypothetical protein
MAAASSSISAEDRLPQGATPLSIRERPQLHASASSTQNQQSADCRSNALGEQHLHHAMQAGEPRYLARSVEIGPAAIGNVPVIGHSSPIDAGQAIASRYCGPPNRRKTARAYGGDAAHIACCHEPTNASCAVLIGAMHATPDRSPARAAHAWLLTFRHIGGNFTNAVFFSRPSELLCYHQSRVALTL